ncbi:hypothetical protein CR513_07190, partial [Mucuna pruriens]
MFGGGGGGGEWLLEVVRLEELHDTTVEARRDKKRELVLDCTAWNQVPVELWQEGAKKRRTTMLPTTSHSSDKARQQKLHWQGYLWKLS